MKAVTITEAREAKISDVKEPSMRPDYVKIKTVAVAVNPTDLHHAAYVGPPGGILGCDVSGIVEEVGKACKTNVQKGDKVYGVCHGANNDNAEDGSFAEFAMIKDGHLAKIPDGMIFEAAATLGMGVTTVGQALYMTLEMPLPTEPATTPIKILIYGGSTATGTLAIQYARLSGFTVITTASPKNFNLVMSRGADAVFDYHDPECGEKIRKYTKNSLRYVLDCISQESSFEICAAALSSRSTDQELHCVPLDPIEPWLREDLKAKTMLAYTTFGEGFTKFGLTFPPRKDHFEMGVTFWKLNAMLVADRYVIPHPATVCPGGLKGVPYGLKALAEGKISGAKLVYRIADTPGELGLSEGSHGRFVVI